MSHYTEEELKSKEVIALTMGITSLFISVMALIMCTIAAPIGLGTGVYAAYVGTRCIQAQSSLETNSPMGFVGMIFGILGGILGGLGTLLILIGLIFLVIYIVGVLALVVFGGM